jgi:hypothetical protein
VLLVDELLSVLAGAGVLVLSLFAAGSDFLVSPEDELARLSVL